MFFRCHFSSLFGFWRTRVKNVFVKFLTYPVSVFLAIEKYKNRTLKYKNKASLLARYSNLFSAHNVEIVFITIVLQYAPKYY